MTRHEIRAVLEKVLTWPPAKQEEAAAMLLAMDAEDASYEPTEAEIAAIRAGLAEAERGEFASDEEAEELLRRPWTR